MDVISKPSADMTAVICQYLKDHNGKVDKDIITTIFKSKRPAYSKMSWKAVETIYDLVVDSAVSQYKQAQKKGKLAQPPHRQKQPAPVVARKAPPKAKVVKADVKKPEVTRHGAEGAKRSTKPDTKPPKDFTNDQKLMWNYILDHPEEDISSPIWLGVKFGMNKDVQAGLKDYRAQPGSGRSDYLNGLKAKVVTEMKQRGILAEQQVRGRTVLSVATGAVGKK